MPIYQTAHYQIRPDAVPTVVDAITEFVQYVTTSEPETLLYAAWQERDDPSRFVHSSRSQTRPLIGPMAAPRRSAASSARTNPSSSTDPSSSPTTG